MKFSRLPLLFFMVIVLQTSCFRENLTKNEKLSEMGNLAGSSDSDSLTYLQRIVPIDSLELPRGSKVGQVIHHTGYCLLYNEQHEQAEWVAYQLTAPETEKSVDRSDRFLVDPEVITGSAENKDYSGSGFDRGHLAPAADMGWSSTTMKESFFYSNMSPQRPEFNRGIWKKLEEQIRDWAVQNDTLYIVTGPVLTDGLPVIGKNQVSIPGYYYKVILDYTLPEIKGIGFILPNEGSNKPLQDYAVSIDSVEKFTGIDFFYLLPDGTETQVEKMFSTDNWNWN